MSRRRLLAAAAGAAALALRPARTRPVHPAADGGEPVDVNLVLAVDVSRSIDEDEARLQREGYRAAVTDPAVLRAIRGGMIGAIGLAYVEWAGFEWQRQVLPWTRIAGADDAGLWAGALAEAPRHSLPRTSLSGAIGFARRVMAEAPWDAVRRVIDVSGDGVNNSGPPPDDLRDRAVAEGITINGLPIINDRPGGWSPVPLDEYFRERVIGGPGAFLIVAEDFEAFGLAVKRKLIREVAGREGAGAG